MNALICVDIQNDFAKGGALAVPDGDDVALVANAVEADLVVATQDWHPQDHGSFAANHAGKQEGDVVELGGLEQILWPVHCVQASRGAEFLDTLDASRLDAVFRKGTDPTIDSYSGFFDNGKRKATGLHDYLNERGVTRVLVLGLATDYCVKFTALDAVALGFETVLIEAGCRGVELAPGDIERALDAMRAAGVTIT